MASLLKLLSAAHSRYSPAGLPFESDRTLFVMPGRINLKVARAIGIEITQAILGRAVEVIE
jgi:hypothetical protein